MGAWGTGIFGNDTSCDVRSTFRDLIGWGYTPEEATNHLLQEFGDDDPDVWLGLAVTQWKHGWLQKSVKAKALQVIDTGADLERWEGGTKKARTKVLAKTRMLLESPQPAAKPFTERKRFKEASDWEVGELVSYQMSSGKHLVFRVCAHQVSYAYRRATLELLNYYDDAPPSLDQARMLPSRILITKYSDEYRPCWQMTMCATSKRQLPTKRWLRLGLAEPLPEPKEDPAPTPMLVGWDDVEASIGAVLPLTCRPGPGGDDHQHWEPGDVFAYRRPTGQYLLFHVLDRFHGHGFDGAPIVATLDWQETSLPSSDAVRSGALGPLAYSLFAGITPPLYYVSVLVHDDADAVTSSALRRIGNFRPTYEIGSHGLPCFCSIPMMVGSFEREQSLGE